MPEGPELFLASIFINSHSKGRLYGGPVIKSEVSTKNPDVNWQHDVYRVTAVARGKELKVTLLEGEEDRKGMKTQDIVFRFGMSGSFKFTPVADLPKHAHLRFFTIKEDTPMVLSFVDYRRFGRWRVEGEWDAERGPDPMWEYQCFRENVLANLKFAAFNKPICETMLNQKFFNGIENYLRAEILYRCGVRPFDEAREVLMELKPISQWYETQMGKKQSNIVQTENKTQNRKQDVGVQPDILDLCHIVPKEVINLSGGGKGYNVDPDADEEEYAAFKAWLRCYYQDGMKNMVDHNGRTMWFSGDPGKLVPKDRSSRSRVKRTNKSESNRETKENSNGRKKQKVESRKQEKVKTTEKRTVKKTAKKTSKVKALKNEEDDTVEHSEYFISSLKTSEKEEKETRVAKKRVSKKSASKKVVSVPTRRSTRRLSA